MDRAKALDIFGKASEMMRSGDASVDQEREQIKKPPPEIVYKLVDESFSLKSAPAQLLGKVLFNMQGLVSSVASSTDGRKSRKLEDLYSLNVGFEDGCLEMKFFPADSQTVFGNNIMERPQTPVFLKTSKLVSILSERNITDDYLKDEIKKQIEDPKARIKVLNCLKGLIPIDKEAKLEFKNVNGGISQIELHDVVFKGRVLRLLKEERKKYETEVFGVISRIRDDAPPSFSVLDWSGNIVKVEMPDDIRVQILDYFASKIPIRLMGVGSKKKGIEDLGEIEPYTKMSIDSVHNMTLKSSINAKVSFEKSEENKEDYWVVGNDDLGIYGVDDTVEKAIEMFKNDLYDDYIAYRDIPDNQLTNRALSLKRELTKIFEG